MGRGILGAAASALWALAAAQRESLYWEMVLEWFRRALF